MTKHPNAETKLAHAQQWLTEKLSYDDGPADGRTAVLVVRIDDVPDEPDRGFTNVFCLPDIHHSHLIEGLERFIADLKANALTIEGEVIKPEGPVQ
jgi:hypothetical protein